MKDDILFRSRLQDENYIINTYRLYNRKCEDLIIFKFFLNQWYYRKRDSLTTFISFVFIIPSMWLYDKLLEFNISIFKLCILNIK